MNSNKNKNKKEAITKNSWLHYSKSSDTAIVFVHGFLSNSTSCWTNKKFYWPSLLLSDDRLDKQNYGVYIAEYYTAIKSGKYNVTDCSKEIFTNLSTTDLIHQAKVIDNKNIVFVCHSLGGIIVRHLLEYHKEHFVNKKIGLLLMGSPSLGSKLTNNPIAKKLRNIYSNTTADQLSLSNAFLMDLDHRFRKLLTSDKSFNIVGQEALESQPLFTFKYLPDFLSLVVEPLSSSRYFEAQTIPCTDHSSLVKPDGLSHPSHSLLLMFLQKEFNSPVLNPQSIMPSKSFSGSEMSNILFDVLNQNSLKYYLLREIDESIRKEQTNRSIWIHGSSGTGKTSSIKNHLYTNQLEAINLCLSHLKNNFSPENLYNEILITAKQLGKYKGNLPTFMPRQTLIDFLVSQSQICEVALYLDEIPFDNESHEMKDFVKCISEIINAVNLRSSHSKIRIFFSSIESPEKAMLGYAKTWEQIALIKFNTWIVDDIHALIELILKHLPELNLSVEEKEELSRIASGSPRTIKNFFRDKSRYCDLSFEQLLNMKNTYEFV